MGELGEIIRGLGQTVYDMGLFNSLGKLGLMREFANAQQACNCSIYSADLRLLGPNFFA